MADCQPAWPRGSSPQLQAAERFCLKGTCIPMRTRFRRRTRAIRGWTVHRLTSAVTTHSPSRIPCRLEASATAGAEACVTKQPSGYPYGLKLLHPIPDSNAHTRNLARRAGQGAPARGRSPAKRTAPLTFSQPLPGPHTFPLSSHKPGVTVYPAFAGVHFSFWTGCRGGRPRRSMPTLIAPDSIQSVQTQEGFVPAGFQNWLVRLNRH
jgi:hypothetical protein